MFRRFGVLRKKHRDTEEWRFFNTKRRGTEYTEENIISLLCALRASALKFCNEEIIQNAEAQSTQRKI
jgi:hypothetical protein